MLHVIDLRDHVNPRNPFGFYRYSEEEWRKLTNRTIFYTNRLRTKDYIDLLLKNNFSVESCVRDKAGKLPDIMDDNFKEGYSIEDLRTEGIILVGHLMAPSVSPSRRGFGGAVCCPARASATPIEGAR